MSPKVSEKSAKPGDALTSARDWLVRDGRAALATVIATWTSAPVPAGTQLAVSADGTFEGSVSGGCIEAEVITVAGELLASRQSRVLEYGVENETAWSVGLACGGRIAVLVEPLHGPDDVSDLNRLIEARASRTQLVVRTPLDSGRRKIFSGTDPAPDAVAATFRSGESRVVGEGADAAFYQARVPVTHLIIAGATEIGQALAHMARPLGWKLSVIDPRAAFASADRFPDVEAYVAWPEAALAGLAVDARTAVVALTHASNIDDETLMTALSSSCFYVGALGSKKNHAGRVERLKAAGLSAEQLARIRAPVGLDIKAKTPAEIAVSILAQVVEAQRTG